MSQFKCPSCQREFDVINALRMHVAKMHDMSALDLYLTLFCDGKRPTCACGCGRETRFTGIQLGFSTFAPGHQARVKNNWGHNKQALEKSIAKRQEMWANGEIKAWATGLTKETDERIAALSRKGSETIMNNRSKFSREQRSELMKQNRLNGTIPTLYGPEHSRWNGGVSTLSAKCHAHPRIYKEWKLPRMIAANYKCEKCGCPNDLCVHHDKERMSDIIRKHSTPAGYRGTKEEYELASVIADAVADYHISQNVSGIVLCYDCHCKEHPTLNFQRPSEMKR